MSEIETKFQALPESAKRDALLFIEFLLQKYNYQKNNRKTFNFTWENTLNDVVEIPGSVELQHQVSEWR